MKPSGSLDECPKIAPFCYDKNVSKIISKTIFSSLVFLFSVILSPPNQFCASVVWGREIYKQWQIWPSSTIYTDLGAFLQCQHAKSVDSLYVKLVWIDAETYRLSIGAKFWIISSTIRIWDLKLWRVTLIFWRVQDEGQGFRNGTWERIITEIVVQMHEL